MARGWESKSVEEQIASARAREQGQGRVALNAHQAEVERKRDSLILQRTRVLRDLGSCQDDRYRQTLESGLAYLESQIALLSEPNA